MTNAELIKALRCEVDCGYCAYYHDKEWNRCDEWGMRCDAADALEKLQSDYEYCSGILNIAIRETGISMTALVKLYEIECADGERSKQDE